MRQIGDLIVGITLVLVLAVAVYYTPRFAAYMSAETREPQAASLTSSLALNPSTPAEDSP